jgi:hypothetical protein
MRLALADPVRFGLLGFAAAAEPRRPVRPPPVDREAEPFGERRQHVAVGRMQPLAAEIRRIAAGFDGPGAAAGALAPLQDEDRDPARLNEPARRRDAGRAGADHRDIDLGCQAGHAALAFPPIPKT